MPEDRTLSGYGQPAERWFAISPSDSSDLAIRPRALYVGGAGNLALKDIDGHVEIFGAAAVGYHALRPVRVLSTGTTATGILGLY